MTKSIKDEKRNAYEEGNRTASKCFGMGMDYGTHYFGCG